ncbi:hypothetical protein [Paenibacillus campi]|uniref:hypothetical protein n=1 Tax=Paenibacillus campi TaxID=3106031 RepID=UPI002AFEC27A|nr:hypothetical protein [Paenibacillus sp. SGZ-1014]
MPQITSDNLDETIQINEMIAKEVNAHVQFIEKRRIKWKLLPIEEQAYAILTEHHLIEVPIPDEDFIVKIAHCMKSFKAPYKAVLIQLYQIARQKDQPSLQSMIKSKFDYQPNFQQWCALFQQHALDDALIRPSLVLNLSPIKIAIQQEIDRHPDVELYRENLALIETWEKMYKEVQQREKERWNEELC